jgi:mercuric ion binding protein
MLTSNHLRAVSLSIGVSVLVMLVSFAAGCRRDTPASAQANVEQSASLRMVAIPVDGMICQVCAGSVKSALKRVEGVNDAEISLEKRNAVIRYDERKVNLEALTGAIKDAGYKAGTPTSIPSR